LTRVLLVRHGEVDGSQLNAEGWWGPARDLSPLSERGIEQAKAAGRGLRDCGARRIIASPMTRALQTASLIAAETRLPLTAVEFDLREWLPDATLSWRSAEAIAALTDVRRVEFCGVHEIDLQDAVQPDSTAPFLPRQSA
jgi:broad specificity phosphatase PhoE